MLTRAVKPTRRPQTANAQPASSLVGLTDRTALCGTRLYGGVAMGRYRPANSDENGLDRMMTAGHEAVEGRCHTG
jgi:hypothetical protein